MKKFSRKSFVLLICVSLILDWNVVLAVTGSDSRSTCCYGENGIFYCGSVAVLAASGCPNGLKRMKYKLSSSRCAMAAGAGVVVLGVPALVAMAGFGAGGIGAGTVAAKMMSWSAFVNGGGVPAGGLVAFLQSLGTMGLASFALTPAGQALVLIGCLIP